MNPDRIRRSLIAAYIDVCRLDVESIKPGNVFRGSDLRDMRAEDFLTSAEVTAEVLTDPDLLLGEAVYRAVERTRTAVGCNTNLGILLLTAPMLQAIWRERGRASLQTRVGEVLRDTSPAQTARLMQAIALAEPGGLGSAARFDVRQYINDFAEVFELAIPGYVGRLSRWDDERWAFTGLFLDILKRFPDTHILRRHGPRKAEWVRRLAKEVADALDRVRDPRDAQDQVLALDTLLKRDRVNPGTSADLTVASALATRLIRIQATSGSAATARNRVRESRRRGAAVQTTPV